MFHGTYLSKKGETTMTNTIPKEQITNIYLLFAQVKGAISNVDPNLLTNKTDKIILTSVVNALQRKRQA